MLHPTFIFAINDYHNDMDFYMHARMDLGLSAKQIIPCRGMYKGETEISYLVAENTFENHFRCSHWIDEQESVLRISGCNKAYAELQYLCGDTGLTFDITGLGSMVCVSQGVATSRDSWTQRSDNGLHYVTEKMNPDHHASLGVES